MKTLFANFRRKKLLRQRLHQKLIYNEFTYYIEKEQCIGRFIEWKGEGYYRSTKLYGILWDNYKLALSKKEFKKIKIFEIESFNDFTRELSRNFDKLNKE